MCLMLEKLIYHLLRNQLIIALLVVVVGWFMYEIRGILVAIFVAYILMAAHLPLVTFLRKYRVPKIFAILVPYLASVTLLVLIIIPLVPFFVSQIQALFFNFASYLDATAKLVGITIDPNQVENLMISEVNNLGKNAFSLTSRAFGGLFSIVTIMVVSFYLLIDNERIKHVIAKLVPAKSHKRAMETYTQIEAKLGAWLRGQLVLSFSIGALTWVVLTVLGIDFAFPLAVIAGILEVVPTIGPIISAIPAVVVALAVSPTMALIVVAAYILIQFLENNILVPKIMEKAVGLNPIVVIIGVMIGAKIMGVVGALLSVPFIAMAVIIFKAIKNSSEA